MSERISASGPDLFILKVPFRVIKVEKRFNSKLEDEGGEGEGRKGIGTEKDRPREEGFIRY